MIWPATLAKGREAVNVPGVMLIPTRRRKRFPWRPYLGAVYSLTVAVALGILVTHWWPEPTPEDLAREAAAEQARHDKAKSGRLAASRSRAEARLNARLEARWQAERDARQKAEAKAGRLAASKSRAVARLEARLEARIEARRDAKIKAQEEAAVIPKPESKPKSKPAPAQKPPAMVYTPPVSPFQPAPAWRRFAAAAPKAQKKDATLVAIVLDDAGVNRVNTRRALTMKAPLTFAFLPYAKNLAPLVARARANGHEVMVHLPMEPKNAANHDTGPNALTVTLSDRELRRRLNWNLNRFQGYVGVNNHMGSRFTADPVMMTKVLRELKTRGLLFLDSRTTPESVADEVAEDVGLPEASRDIFIDNEISAENIASQLVLLRRVAKRNGSAIAIGHPHKRTLEALEVWVEEIEAEGFVLAPVSAVVQRRMRERAVKRYVGG